MFDTVDLVERCGKAAGADVCLTTDDELLAAAVDSDAARRHLDAFQAHVLAELHKRGVTEAQHGLRTGPWLAHTTGSSHSGCRRRAEVAVKLRRLLPLVDEALTAGRISWDHASVLVGVANPRIAPVIAGLQAELLTLADRLPFDRWRREIWAIAELADVDGGHDPTRDRDRNELHLTEVGDVTQVSGRLVGELALLVRSAIDAKADRLFRRAHADATVSGTPQPLPSRATLRAEALGELCRTGQACDLETSRPPNPEVVLIVRADQAQGDDCSHTPDSTLVRTAETLPRTIDGAPLADGTIRTLLCDAWYRPLVVDNLGTPLDVGRAVRFATSAQRRALAVRDSGCVWPGCDKPPGWCDAHHIIPVHEGGPTDLANLALQCRHHHGLTHSTGWTMHAADDGWFWWQTPTGRRFWSQRHGRQRDGPTPEGRPPPNERSTDRVLGLDVATAPASTRLVERGLTCSTSWLR